VTRSLSGVLLLFNRLDTLSVSQLLDEGFEVLFRPSGSRILDSRGDLVCMVVPEGQVFRAAFSQSSGVERCFLAGSSSELWKRHMKLGHLSSDLLSRLSNSIWSEDCHG
jgi:hypothetical protein